MRIKTLITTFIVLCLALCNEVCAQTIHISPSTGSVIAAASYSGELHEADYGGAWIHNQVSLTWMTSDNTYLTENGLLRDHANNIAVAKSDPNKFVIIGGSANDAFYALSLPKGYRFTGYRMILTNDVTNGDYSQSIGSGTSTFAETNSGFNRNNVSTTIGSHDANNHTKYTLQRTSLSKDDMGNILYFQLTRPNSDSFVAAYVEYFEISFECSDPFVEPLKPTTAISNGVACTNIAFNTGLMDMGQISWSTGGGTSNYSFRYNYKNLKDLSADFTLYNVTGVVDGTAVPGTVGDGSIKADNQYFFLNNNTYYIESPTEAVAQGNINIPLGYRITGAKLYYDFDHQFATQNQQIYITDGNGKYLNASLNFTSEKVAWNIDGDGKIWIDNAYLRVDWDKELTTTTRQNQATGFTKEGNNLYYGQNFLGSITKYYICVSGTKGVVSTNGTKATFEEIKQEIPTAAYTLNLYDKTGNSIAQSVTVNENNKTGYIEVSGLNNDAIKFSVKGLPEGAQACVYAELTLEVLNPYVANMDVVGKTQGGTIVKRQYIADDFMLGNGEVNFEIPTSSINEGEKAEFWFDNLENRNADDTYGDMLSRTGNSRYNFVKSAYYDVIGENLQGHRTEAADYNWQNKVKVAVTGTQAFKANNSELFKVGVGQSSWTGYYERFRYSNPTYTTQGGDFEAINLGKDENKDIYLMVCDETRYNIAPTTTPRHAYYAYYNTKLKVTAADYDAKFTYTKIYDSAYTDAGDDQNAYYGVKAEAQMYDGSAMPEGYKGYLTTEQIRNAVRNNVNKEGFPVDAKHILYIDASNLNTVADVTESGGESGAFMKEVKGMIGDNAIIFLPVGTTYSLDNFATKSQGGDFTSNGNIVLVDQKPFYSPYDIRVNASNYAKYTRKITPGNGRVTHSTLILPFSVAVDEKGTHEDRNTGEAFTFYNMQLTNALSNPTMEDNYNYQVDGHFMPLAGMTAAEPNKPYLVVVDNQVDDEAIVFNVEQYGSDIHKTPDAVGGQSRIEGETATGTVEGATDNVQFKAYGTFNGAALEKEGGYFYFANNRFVSSYNLNANKPVVKVRPFRTYYDYAGPQNVRYMNVSLDENTEITGITDITSGNADYDFTVAAGSGEITVTALRDLTVGVQTINGQTAAITSMKEGSSHTFSLPAGIYIVNGKKIAVR